jgi:tetratricopeptide (TPR) repeat protein
MKRACLVISIIILLILIAAVFVSTRTISSGMVHRPGPDILQRLRAEQPRRNGDRTWFGQAWRENRQSNIVLSMTGDPYEMGFQHGVLLRQEIAKGVVPVFGNPVSQMREYRGKPAILQRLILLYLDFVAFGPLERNTPAEYLQELKGNADGAGIDYRLILRATFKSELTMIMLPGLVKDKVKAFGIRAECADFAAAGAATADGKLVIGRNTDYDGQGRWIAAQTIFVYRPARGHSYVNISTAGLVKCNSALNDHGIFIGGHFMGFDETGPRGLSFTILEHEIMRRASTLQEALAILRRTPRAGSFGYMLAAGASREALVIEANDVRMGVRGMDNNIAVVTNYALTEELKPVDLMARYNLVMRGIAGRHYRLEEMLAADKGRITPARAAAYMGDRLDWVTRTERATGITVGAADNVTSAVFVPEDGIFWLASGIEPACDGIFHGYNARALLEDGDFKNIPSLRPYAWKNSSHEMGLRHFMKAYAAHEENIENFEGMIRHLDRAIAADPEESIYLRLKASLLLHSGLYREAVHILEKSLDLDQSNNEHAHALLMMGQGLDLLEERDAALVRYGMVKDLYDKNGRDIKKGVNDMLMGFCRHYIEKPFTVNSINDIPVAFHSESGIE